MDAEKSGKRGAAKTGGGVSFESMGLQDFSFPPPQSRADQWALRAMSPYFGMVEYAEHCGRYDESVIDAVWHLREQRNDPYVAISLAHLVNNSPHEAVRDAALAAVGGTTDEDARTLLNDYLVRQLKELEDQIKRQLNE